MAALMNMLRRSTSPDADLAGFEEEEADASTFLQRAPPPPASRPAPPPPPATARGTPTSRAKAWGAPTPSPRAPKTPKSVHWSPTMAKGKRVPLSPVQNLQKRASPAKAAAPQELPAFTDAQRAAAKEKRRRRRTTGFTAADVEAAPARVGDLHIPAFDPSTPKGKKKPKKRTPPRDPNATPPEVRSLRKRVAALETVWKSNLQPDFNVRVIERFGPDSFAVLRELDESDRSVQKSAESTSI